MIYTFGPFALDTELYELRRDGEALPGEPKVLEVLAFLIAERHRIVAKEELVAKVWQGRFVSDSAVSRAIREVRRLLGDTAAESRWIKTVYGRGFAFAGQMEMGEQGTKVDSETAVAELRNLHPGLRLPPLPAPLTPLIGRESELEEITRLLDAARLLTLTGTGGAGKTRLALEVARTFAGKRGGEVAFVGLAEIREPDRVPGALALALGTGDAIDGSALETLRRSLGGRRLLLVLDNFEQVLGAAPVVASLLSDCPGLTVLVTSRFVLRVAGEREYPVRPLALPAGSTGEKLAQAPSVALFLDRARAVRHDFFPEGEDLAHVAEICRRLDGLPLAIELAAARIKVLSPRELWQRLAERLDLLSAPAVGRPERHRTLELALSWSHDLLEEGERTLFRRLSVFAGGFPLAAAEQVCGEGDGRTLDQLTALAGKSLIRRLPSVAGRSRLGLLETTRDFARIRLEAAGEVEEIRRKHAAWVAEVARAGESQLAGGEQERVLERLDAEHGNVLAALSWARSGGDVETGLATAAAVARYWSARGTYREGRKEVEALLAHAGPAGASPTVEADARVALGMLCLLLCDYPAAADALERARSLLRPLGDRQRLAHTLNHLGWVIAQGTEVERAGELSREALSLHREAGEPARRRRRPQQPRLAGLLPGSGRRGGSALRRVPRRAPRGRRRSRRGLHTGQPGDSAAPPDGPPRGARALARRGAEPGRAARGPAPQRLDPLRPGCPGSTPGCHRSGPLPARRKRCDRRRLRQPGRTCLVPSSPGRGPRPAGRGRGGTGLFRGGPGSLGAFRGAVGCRPDAPPPG